MTDQRCENCRFWKAIGPAPRMGDCRKRSPVPHMGQIAGIPVWPEVGSDDWCGEWENEHGLSSHVLMGDKDKPVVDMTYEEQIRALESNIGTPDPS